MSNSTHPSNESLLEFLDTPEIPELQAVALHLASCASCRQQAMQLKDLTQRLHAHKADSGRYRDPLSQDESQAVIENNLDVEQLQIIKRDPAKLKAALHLATHVHGGQEEAQTPSPVAATTARARTQTDANPSHGGFSELIATWLGLRPQVWLSAAFTAVLVFALSFSFFQVKTTPDIVAYQDNPVIVFKQVQTQSPGIGFFSDISTRKARFGGMRIQAQDNDKLRFQWPAVENATQYTLRLHRVQQGRPQLIQETTTANNWVEFDSLPLQSGVRYEWQLSGKTKQQHSFKTAGGFVVQE